VSNMNKKLTQTVLSFALVALFFGSIVVGTDLSNNVQEKEKPQASASSDFGVSIGDWFTYRRWVNDSKDRSRNEYVNYTIYCITDNGDNTTINWTEWKAAYPDFNYILNNISSAEYNITDNATWWGKEFIVPKNISFLDYQTYLDTQWPVVFPNVTILSTNYTASTINVTGTKNSKPFMFYYEIIPSLGVMKTQILIEEGSYKMTSLVKTNRISSYPDSFGVVPGDVLNYYTPVNHHPASFTDVVIDFVYEEKDSKIAVGTYKFYLNAGGIQTERYVELGRINASNLSVGYSYQSKQISFLGREAELISILSSIGFTSISVYLEEKYLQFTGMEGSTQRKMEFRYPKDNSTGVPNFEAQYENGTMKSVFILINGKGVNQNPANYPYISLPETANWEIISQHIEDKREPRPGGGDIYTRQGELVYIKFQISHIFEFNGSGAVYGDVWKSSTRTYTTKKDTFYPFLIHDGSASLNFMNAANMLKEKYNITISEGYGPILFPSNLNFASVQTELQNMLKQEWGVSSFSYFEAGSNYAIGSIYNNETYFYGKINNKGLIESYRERSEFKNSTFEMRRKEMSFLLSTSVGCASPTEQTFGVSTGAALVWEQSESEDPAKKGWYKKQIDALVDTCSGAKVILSSEFWRDNKSAEWNPQNYCTNLTWGSSGPECSESMNLYLTNLVDKNEKLTWMECDILPKEIITAGFDSKKADIIWVLKAFMGDVSESNIVVWNRGFVAWQVDSEGWNHSMRIQFNEEGIMQDMLWMDEKPGQPTRWRRQVLVDGNGQKYEYFDNPSGYIPAERDETEEPGFIDGFPLLIFSIVSLAAIAYAMKRKVNPLK